MTETNEKSRATRTKGTTSTNWIEADREAAVLLEVVTRPGQYTGENFPAARSKLRNAILRPHDINLVDAAARRLHNQGLIEWKKGGITPNIEKIMEWLRPLYNQLDSAPERVKQVIMKLDEFLASKPAPATAT